MHLDPHLNLSARHRLVEGLRQRRPPLLVRVEDPGLGTHDHSVLLCLAQPAEVVVVLLDDGLGDAVCRGVESVKRCRDFELSVPY